MATDRKAPNNGAASQKNQTVLILNQNSAPCAAETCNGLVGVLQRSLSIGCVQGEERKIISDPTKSRLFQILFCCGFLKRVSRRI